MKKGFTPNYCVNCSYHYEPWKGDEFGMCKSCDNKENARAFALMRLKEAATNSKLIDQSIPLIRKFGMVKMAKLVKINKSTLTNLCNPNVLVGNPPLKVLTDIMRVLGREIIVINSLTKHKQNFSLKNLQNKRVKNVESDLKSKGLELSINEISSIQSNS